ncbi:Tubulinyl-Tyr carboxypeptidase 2, variant 2 [Schistosoma haematobium]|uniref:Tubulinyl-Tyr carboxypeptidase 2, variant 2 n=1 Tax=Schistosoma haematobium TaxID=6185 RepID=A0A922LVN5_SCHHA|nr:Tubulinyl-Tyr carboxypeptidase 2, variant 2 [Schistosoma haematobium]KAH9594457.1 Tubulinyl-Tyr carboxypeptidase 2, variant 2 [Schistosoma haematobium]
MFTKLPEFRVDRIETAEMFLSKVQNYLNSLEYNYTGMQFFQINRGASIVRLEEVVKMIMLASLPIKCLEATILAIFLTQGQEYLKRFTISFVSEFNGKVFRHVVLGIYSSGLFGALGLSRRENLMYKPLNFPSLSLLINNYTQGYHGHHHKLLRVKIGLPISHRPYMLEKIQWKGIIIPFNKGYTKKDINNILDHYSRFLRGSTNAIIKKSLPNISSDSFKTAKKQQNPSYRKVIRLGMVRNKSDNKVSSSLSISSTWRSVTNLPIINSKLARSQTSTNSYEVRI